MQVDPFDPTDYFIYEEISNDNDDEDELEDDYLDDDDQGEAAVFVLIIVLQQHNNYKPICQRQKVHIWRQLALPHANNPNFTPIIKAIGVKFGFLWSSPEIELFVQYEMK